MYGESKAVFKYIASVPLLCLPANILLNSQPGQARQQYNNSLRPATIATFQFQHAYNSVTPSKGQQQLDC